MCTAHSIEARDLFNAVLADINRFADMAVNDEKAVRAIERRLTETDQSRAKSLEKEKKKLNKRLAELDRLFSSLYEDKVMERITERNFEMMSGKYQKEQLEIEARLKEVTETLNDSYEKSQGVRDFLSLIRNYQGLKELDATIINALIDKILVSEREKLADGTVRQEIKIYYKFIGFVGELHITPTKRWTALKPKNCTVCGVEYVPSSGMRTDWEHFSLLENGLTLSPYNFITILIATGVCALVAFLYYRFCYDSFKKLLHRQKLARMVLENKWYEADTVQDSGFFTDLQSRSREKIVWFPKIYYQMEKGLLHIRCEITLGKYQDQLLRLEDKLESGLYCELTDKTLHDGYIEYTLLYDMIANRITIDEVRAENGCLRLMKNLVWEYDTLPHALIAGGTGGGKTYFLLTLIEALLHTNAVLYILDPKNADLADLGTVMGNVYHTKEEMIDCVNAFYEGMVQRSEEMKRHPNYKTGENYAYLGLPPCFLIFDEYVAFFEMLGTKESVSLLSQLKKIVMLGRQAGYFLIVACQRPDAKYFSDGIRDNFNFRVGLGRISELGYGMLFGSDVKKQFFQKRIKGRGYCDVGTSVISEFYTPLVPKGHDFLQTIGSLAQARQDGTATCEAKGDGTD